MNKSILMSIKPQYVAKILNGEKTIEVRKKFPKDYVGWVYIYCTKGRKQLIQTEYNIKWQKEILFELVSPIREMNVYKWLGNIKKFLNGKVVARFWCDKVSVIERYCGTFIPINGYTTFLDKRYSYEGLKEATCLSDEELFRYLGNKNGYAIHISKLEVFDKSRDINEFYTRNLYTNIDDMFTDEKQLEDGSWIRPIKKAPQSWQFIEGE